MAVRVGTSSYVGYQVKSLVHKGRHMSRELDQVLVEFDTVTKRLESASPIRKYVIAAVAAVAVATLLQLAARAAGFDAAERALWIISGAAMLAAIGLAIALSVERTRTARQCVQLAHEAHALNGGAAG